MDITGTAGASRWRFLYGGGPSTGTNSLTESMCILTEGASAGNVGVGTSSPSYKLNVSGANYVFGLTGGGTSRVAQTFVNTGGNLDLGIEGSAGGQLFTGGSAYASCIGSANSTNLQFGTNGTIRATIDTSGNLLVGTTSGSTHSIDKSIENDYSLNIRNTATANTYGITSRFPNASPNGAGNQFLICSDSSATRMLVYSNGGIANYSANNVNLSDRREKTNFAPATSYLDKICAIPVQTFNYIDQNMEDDGGLTLGVVAQDVQAVAPELVLESNWANRDADPKMRLSIYQTDLQYALMKCIQEQQALITQLKARLDAANL